MSGIEGFMLANSGGCDFFSSTTIGNISEILKSAIDQTSFA